MTRAATPKGRQPAPEPPPDLIPCGGQLRVHAALEPLLVDIAGLRPHPRNARVHHDDVIEESLRLNGQYRPVVVNIGSVTGRPMELLAGHGTWHAACALGGERIAATFVDVDEARASRILLVDNRANDLARYEDGLLAQLLGELPDLGGTGYDDRALVKLLEEAADPHLPLPGAGEANDPWSEWRGMPEFEAEDKLAWQTVKVHLRNEEDRNALARLLGQPLGPKPRFVWYPAEERDKVAHLAYVSGDQQGEG